MEDEQTERMGPLSTQLQYVPEYFVQTSTASWFEIESRYFNPQVPPIGIIKILRRQELEGQVDKIFKE